MGGLVLTISLILIPLGLVVSLWACRREGGKSHAALFALVGFVIFLIGVFCFLKYVEQSDRAKRPRVHDGQTRMKDPDNYEGRLNGYPATNERPPDNRPFSDEDPTTWPDHGTEDSR